MSQIIAYLRTSTDNQKLEILEWSCKKDLKVDEFVEITMSSRKTSKQRRIEEVLHMCECWLRILAHLQFRVVTPLRGDGDTGGQQFLE